MALLSGIFLLTLGWIAGLLINYLADQLPFFRSLHQPRCRRCSGLQSWLQFFFQEDCPICGATQANRHKAVQIAYPLLFIGSLFWIPGRLILLEVILILTYFGLVLIIDLEHRLILNLVIYVGAFLGIIAGFRLHGPGNTLLGGAAGFAMMLILYWIGELFTHFLSKRRGEPIEEVALGFGDVNLSGVLGLFLGWPGITLGLFVAIVLGGIASAVFLIVMTLRREYKAFTALPYAPFLLFATLFLLFRP